MQTTEDMKMGESLLNTQEVKDLLTKVSGLANDAGDPRLKRIMHRMVSDLFRVIEDFDVQPDEFWSAVGYITALGQANEAGLLVPGLGIETFLDLRMDEAERRPVSRVARHARSKGRFTSPAHRCPRGTHVSMMAARRVKSCS
jgi:hypothetical protein